MRQLTAELVRQQERLFHCVHCGFCLSACPTYALLADEADSPRGRLHLMRALMEGRVHAGSPSLLRHLDRCLGCRACETVCPSGVEYGRLLEVSRSVTFRNRSLSPALRLILAVFMRPRLRRLCLGALRVLRWGGFADRLARILPAGRLFAGVRLGLRMLSATRPSPLLSQVGGNARRAERSRGAEMRGESSREGGVESAAVGGELGGMIEGGGRVALFRGCVQEDWFRHVNEATERVLGVHGFEVVTVPGGDCCGALHAHAGDLEGARVLARRVIRSLRGLEVAWVVNNAAGCGAAMREYPFWLGEDPEMREEAERFAERVRDISELLVSGPAPERGVVPVAVAHDSACHLFHAQGIRNGPESFLRTIPGVRLTALPDHDHCCGGAGLWALTHPELGARIGADKVRAILASGADVVATANPGCIMQIGGNLKAAGAGVPVVHPVEILDLSYRLAGHDRAGGPERREVDGED